MFGYSVLRAGLNRDYFTALMDDMLAFGVPLEGLTPRPDPCLRGSHRSDRRGSVCRPRCPVQNQCWRNCL